MDLLKNEQGFSMIEALAGIALIGLLLGLTATVLLQLYNNPKTFLRSEAILLAEREINFCKSVNPDNDTTYTNSMGNLEIYREVLPGRSVKKINVSVTTVNKLNKLVDLQIVMRK